MRAKIGAALCAIGIFVFMFLSIYSADIETWSQYLLSAGVMVLAVVAFGIASDL